MKILMRHKLFTFISLFGISFTLMVLMLVTSLVDHTFGKMAPETRLERTLSSMYFRFSHSDKHSSSNGPIMSYYFFDKYAKSLETPEKVSIASFHRNMEIYRGNKKMKIAMKYTDAEFWDILDFTFVEGKPYTNEDVKNINPVAVINENTQKQYFGGDDCIGKLINLNNKNYQVIGVVKNVSALRFLPYSDVWIPITNSDVDLYEPRLESSSFPSFFALALAKDKKDLPLIKSEFQNKLENVEFFNDSFNQLDGGFETYYEAIAALFFGRGGAPNTTGLLITILLIMLLFMLLPTINLVNINISRIMERSSEIGIRKAFGASSLTLIGQFIIENILITLIGGALALIFSAIILMIINQAHLIKYVELAINWRIFYKSLLICLFWTCFRCLSGIQNVTFSTG